MVNKRKKAVQYILMVLITLLVVFPFLWMLWNTFHSCFKKITPVYIQHGTRSTLNIKIY